MSNLSSNLVKAFKSGANITPSNSRYKSVILNMIEEVFRSNQTLDEKMIRLCGLSYYLSKRNNNDGRIMFQSVSFVFVIQREKNIASDHIGIYYAPPTPDPRNHKIVYPLKYAGFVAMKKNKPDHFELDFPFKHVIPPMVCFPLDSLNVKNDIIVYTPYSYIGDNPYMRKYSPFFSKELGDKMDSIAFSPRTPEEKEADYIKELKKAGFPV